MLSWSLGGYPSPNLDLFNRITRREAPEKVLDDSAQSTFGQGAPHARKAWTLFSQAFQEFPYNGATLYTAPQQFGPANLLFAKPTAYQATMIGFPYDDLKTWRGPYPENVFISQLQKLTDTWSKGLAGLKQAADSAPQEKSQPAHRDLRLAQAAHLHFASVAAQSQFIQTRNALSTPTTDRPKLITELRQLLTEEATRARDLYYLQQQDSRIGFEASNQYYYLPRDLQEKFLNCQYLLETMKP
jgi:hypothetical protein